MQQSMTGYGRSEKASHPFLITTELKTLNSKFLDLSPRFPKELAHREAEIRTMVTKVLKRGKVMLTIEIELADDETSQVQVDEQLFKTYYDKFKVLSDSVNGDYQDLIKLAIEAPDVIKQQEFSPDQLPWEVIKASVQESLDQCMEFRKSEGAALVEKLNNYITNIEGGLVNIEESDTSRSEHIRGRLQKSIDEIRDKVKVDENRFEQELIFYLERLDITEEKVRLKQHLEYFHSVMNSEEDAGKKLGFIAQEIGREINTIGSKANNADIQRTVVMMKDDLEKIKEQSLNLL